MIMHIGTLATPGYILDSGRGNQSLSLDLSETEAGELALIYHSQKKGAAVESIVMSSWDPLVEVS